VLAAAFTSIAFADMAVRAIERSRCFDGGDAHADATVVEADARGRPLRGALCVKYEFNAGSERFRGSSCLRGVTRASAPRQIVVRYCRSNPQVNRAAVVEQLDTPAAAAIDVAVALASLAAALVMARLTRRSLHAR
jgi:hypothetical protein